MKKTNKLALKAGGWYIFSNFLIKGVAVISTPIVTRLLSPSDFGIANTYTSVLGLMTVVGTLDLYSSVQIARHDYSEEEMNSFLSSILTLSTISVGLLYFIFKIMGNLAVEILGIEPFLIDFMFLSILLSNAFTILQTKHRAYMRYKEFVYLSILVAITSPLLSVLLIMIMDSDLYIGRIVGNAIPKMVISFFIFLSIYKDGKTLYNKSYWKYALSISIPLIPHHLSTNVLSQFDRIMINQYVGAFAVGLYSLAYSYSVILSVVWTSFNQAWVPWFYDSMKNENYEDIKKYIKPYTILFSLFFIGMLVTGPEALRLFGPEEYWNGMWVIPPVLLGVFFQFMYSLYVNIEFFLKKTQYIALGTILAAGINITLNILFIPRFGFISAAYTTLFGYVVLFIVHYFISKRWFPRDIIGLKFLLRWILLIICITIVTTFLYPYAILRYSLFSVISSIIVFLNKTSIKVLYTSIKIKNKK